MRPGPRGAEPHATGRRQHHGLVAHRQDRGEADAEPPDAARIVPLGRRPQGYQSLYAAVVQRDAGVGRQEDVPGQFQAQPPGDAGPEGGVGGVLCQLDQQPVAVAAADQVLLGVGVLPEAGRGIGPGGEHATADPRGVEGVARPASGLALHGRASRRGPARRGTSPPSSVVARP
ncbi:hypothetical protein E4P39_21990 [Blastococcus sp. CT_GayMR19]|nr:hypothetical protein E4P39_21990 [Blastococcus sp. CT_GayMR19]